MHRAVPWIALGLVLGASPAGAEPETEAIRLIYEAPLGCPTAGELEAMVRSSAPHVRVIAKDANDADGRAFTVSVETATSARGRLTITKRGAVLGTREVRGERCEEVASILAFAVALAVDPRATLPEDVARDAVVERREKREGTKPAEREPETKAPPATHDSSRTRWGLSAHALSASGLAPTASFGGGLSGELGAQYGALAPSFRLGFKYATSAPATKDGARVTFADALALVEACPTSWERGGFSFRPCARIEGGLRSTASEGIPGAHGVTRPWTSPWPPSPRCSTSHRGRWRRVCVGRA